MKRCKDCKKLIDETSAYCCYCGNKQKLFFERKLLRRLVLFYPAWFVLHLIVLFFFSDGPFDEKNATSQLDTFYPFNIGMAIGVYDLTEFIIYTCVPLLFIFIQFLQNKLTMRVAVVGSRTFNDYDLLKETLDMVYITGIISGGSLGADTLAEQYAKEKNIPVMVIPDANHERSSSEHPASGRAYSIISQAQLVVAFWNGKSQGTHDLIAFAQRKGKQVKIKYFKE